MRRGGDIEHVVVVGSAVDLHLAAFAGLGLFAAVAALLVLLLLGLGTHLRMGLGTQGPNRRRDEISERQA